MLPCVCKKEFNMARRKKKNTIRSAKALDEKYLGTEPVLNDNPSDADLINAFNWYRYFCDSEKSKKFILQWMKENTRPATDIKLINKVSKHDITKVGISTGWLARIMFQGTTLQEDTLSIFENNIEALKTIGKTYIDESKKEKEEKTDLAPAISIQARTKLKGLAVLDVIEESYYKNEDLDAYQHLQANNITSAVATIALDKFEKHKEEVVLAYTKKNEQCVEAYENVPRRELKKMMVKLEDIVSGIDRYVLNSKKTRKPRKKKETPITKLVEKMKYKTSDKELKLESIDPVKIIGCDRLIVYNTKYRSITILSSDKPEGLTVKGTTIQNFGSNSQSRKLRKPEDVLDLLLKATKAKSVKIVNSLTTKPSKANGRINKDTILLKVYK